MGFSGVLLSTVLMGCLSLSSWAAPKGRPYKQEAPPKDLEFNLKAAVQDIKPKLGALDPQQSAIFDEEVVSQYRRFIREFRQSGDNTIADVDVENIKRYVALTAAKSGAKSDAKMGVLFISDAACDRCKESSVDVRKLVRTRLERRGFKVVLIANEEVGTTATAAELYGKTIGIARGKNLTGALIVQLAPAAPDAIDTAHADDKRFQSKLHLSEFGQNGQSDIAAEGVLEILDNDSLLSATERLLTDAFTDLGSKVLIANARPEDPRAEETLISVRGIGDFDHYSKIKSQLKELLKDAGFLEERKSARGLSVYALRTRRSAEDVKGLLQGLGDDSGPVQVEVQ